MYRMGRTLSGQNRVYSFKRVCQIQPYTINAEGVPTAQTTTPYVLSNYVTAGKFTFGHLRFRLDMLPNYQDLTNLYERYKITGIKLRWMPINGTSSDVDRPTSGSQLTTLAIAINRGAFTVSADDRTFTTCLENQDVKLYNSQKPFSLYIPYPKFYAPADGIVAAQEKSGWINTKNPDVDHFGVNWAFEHTTTSEFLWQGFRVYATVYVKCCNPQ